MDKNNLDELYQQKLNDFEQLPEPHVWQRIEASLDKKQKKRIVPIWWYFGGAAALLLLGLWLSNPFSVEHDLNHNPVTLEENTDRSNSNGASDNNTNSNENSDLEPTTTVEKDKVVKEANQVADTKVQPIGERVGSENQNIDRTKTYAGKNAVKKNTAEVANNTEASSNKEKIAAENSSVAELSRQAEQEREVIASVEPDETKEEKNNEGVLNNEVNRISEKETTEVAQNTEDEKMSIQEVIDAQEDIVKLSNQDSNKKWSVGPQVAPVYFNAFGEGSPIHSDFAQNAKTGNINLSYGLMVAYDIGDKLTLRSGVHRVNYGYDTDEVLFSSTLNANSNDMIDNINYSQASRGVVVQSKTTSTAEDFAAANQGDALVSAPTFEGSMIQQMGYLEVPLELSYDLLDKKFGINLIGGVSSLFLIDNFVALQANEMVTEMGEANNVNDINFSTNVGVGFNYNFSDKLQLNVEPMFKYQLGTFSDSAGNFSPYSIGVYSGLRLRL